MLLRFVWFCGIPALPVPRAFHPCLSPLAYGCTLLCHCSAVALLAYAFALLARIGTTAPGWRCPLHQGTEVSCRSSLAATPRKLSTEDDVKVPSRMVVEREPSTCLDLHLLRRRLLSKAQSVKQQLAEAPFPQRPTTHLWRWRRSAASARGAWWAFVGMALRRVVVSPIVLY